MSLFVSEKVSAAALLFVLWHEACSSLQCTIYSCVDLNRFILT
eukprot:COSAG01_NODE_41621_length_449_cov_0.734286_1_plen_42_part_10